MKDNKDDWLIADETTGKDSRSGWSKMTEEEKKKKVAENRRKARRWGDILGWGWFVAYIIFIFGFSGDTQEVPVVQRDVYLSKEDCLADWGTEESCEVENEFNNQNQTVTTRYYSPSYTDDAEKEAKRNYKPTNVNSKKVSVAYYNGSTGAKINSGDVVRNGFGKASVKSGS